ncbi:MAG: bacteriohemerythrin [Bacteroidota bacterium]
MKKIKLTIKTQLIFLSVVLTLIILIISGISINNIQKTSNISEYRDNIASLIKDAHQIRSAETSFYVDDVVDSDFYANGTSKGIMFHDTMFKSICHSIAELKESKYTEQFEVNALVDDVLLDVTAYDAAFNNIKSSQTELGFLGYGLMGDLRKSFGALETSLKEKSQNKDLEVSVLILRTNEKDFVLSRKINFKAKFNEECANLSQKIEANFEAETKAELLLKLDTYKKDFSEVVAHTAKIYGDESGSKGLDGEMDKAVGEVLPALANIEKAIDEKVAKDQLNTEILFAILASIAVLLSAILSVIIVRLISQSLVKTKVVIGNVAQGDLNIDITTFKDDEFGEIAKELDRMNNGLKIKTEFAKHIGEGALDAQFEPLGEKDDLGASLLEMQHGLQKAAQEEIARKKEDDRRNWSTEGAAKFAEILRQNNDNMELLSFNIIRNLVEYTGMNQGGLFIYNDNDKDHPFLEMTACYAFNRQKFMQKTIEIGEGLVGACYQEGATIYLTDIPDDYVNITSGLGKANPNCVLIVPLKLNDQIFGIIELASFRKLEKHEIEFTEKVGESIASTISSVKVNIRTAQLLEVSQQQAEEMRAQEEEMRQNMEEMHATQEELQRKEQMTTDMVEKMRVQESELKENLAAMTEKEKYTQDLIETMKQQEEELRQNMEEVHATQEELSRKDIIQQEEINRLRAENETILEKTLSKEFEYQKIIDDLKGKLTGSSNNSNVTASDDKLMEWSDAVFSVDINLIDDQHKKLLMLINNLYASFKKGQAREKMGEILNELVNYTTYHFGVEEKYFEDFRYEGTPGHLKEHVKFVDTVLKFKEEFTTGKAAVSYEVLNFLKDWLISHIQVTDRGYVECFKQHGL